MVQKSEGKGDRTMSQTEGRKDVSGLLYVRDMLPQLKSVSGVPEGEMLHYILDMARLEVEAEIDRRQAGSVSKKK